LQNEKYVWLSVSLTLPQRLASMNDFDEKMALALKGDLTP